MTGLVSCGEERTNSRELNKPLGKYFGIHISSCEDKLPKIWGLSLGLQKRL